MIRNLKGLIIEPNGTARIRLIQVLKSIVLKADLDQAREYRLGLERLEHVEDYDAVLIGSSDDKSEVNQIIDSANSKTKKPIIIVSLKAKQQDGGYIAQLYQKGVQGIIKEPYSAEIIADLLTLTREVAEEAKKDPAGEEKKALSTFNFLINNARGLINRVAIEKVKGNEAGGYAMKEFQEMVESVRGAGDSVPVEAVEKLLLKNFKSKEVNKKYAAANTRKKRKPRHKHPGSKIREVMSSRGLSIERLEKSLQLDGAEFKAVLEESAAITQDVAKELARMLGQTQGYWLDLQKKFEKANPKWAPSFISDEDSPAAP